MVNTLSNFTKSACANLTLFSTISYELCKSDVAPVVVDSQPQSKLISRKRRRKSAANWSLICLARIGGQHLDQIKSSCTLCVETKRTCQRAGGNWHPRRKTGGEDQKQPFRRAHGKTKTSSVHHSKSSHHHNTSELHHHISLPRSCAMALRLPLTLKM